MMTGGRRAVGRPPATDSQTTSYRLQEGSEK